MQSRPSSFALVCAVSVLCLLPLGCSAPQTPPRTPIAQVTAKPELAPQTAALPTSASIATDREIRYVVTGVENASTNATISYPNGNLRNERLPWSKVETSPIETKVALSADGVGNDGEFFIAEIYVDGRLIARDEGQDASVKVTCDAKGCDDF